MPVKYKQCQGPCGESKLLDAFWADSKQPDGKQKRCISCVKQARQDRQERRRNGEDVPAIDEAERQRRSERAIELHAQGKLGGPDFGKLGGRPRKPRLSDAVLDEFREKTGLLIRAVESNLRSNNKSQRMRAVEYLTNLEQQEDKRQREARGAGKDPADMTPEELEEFIVQGLVAKAASGELDLSGVINLDPSQVTDLTHEAA